MSVKKAQWDPGNDPDLQVLWVDTNKKALEIAEQFGVSEATIYKHARRLGLPSRRAKLWTEKEDDQIRWALRTLSDVLAEEFNRTPGAVRTRMVRALTRDLK